MNKKTIMIIIVFFTAITFVSAFWSGKSSFNDSVTDQTQIDLAIDNGVEITSDQFALASAAQQEKYVLGENVNFDDKNQQDVFRRLASAESFSIRSNERNTLVYLRYVSLEGGAFLNQQNLEIFQKTAREDLSIINEDKSIFTSFAIQKYGVSFTADTINPENKWKFKSFNQATGEFVTDGTKSTKFTMIELKTLASKGFLDFEIDKTGQLKFSSEKTGNVIIEGGDFRIEEDVKMTSGKISFSGLFEGKTAEIPKNCAGCSIMLFKTGAVQFEGKDFQLPDGNKLLSGKVKIDSISGRTDIFAGSDYQVYEKGKPALDYIPSKDTIYYRESGKCAQSSALEYTCIEDYSVGGKRFVDVIAQGDNKIKISQYATNRDEIVNMIRMPLIIDNSSLTFERIGADWKKSIMEIGNHPVLVKGDKAQLPEFDYTYVNEKLITCRQTSANWQSTADCRQDLGRGLSKITYDTMKEYADAVNEKGVGTHYGTKSKFAELVGTKDNPGGEGYTEEEALVYVMLLKNNILSDTAKEDIDYIRSLRESGKEKLVSLDDAMRYVSYRTIFQGTDKEIRDKALERVDTKSTLATEQRDTLRNKARPKAITESNCVDFTKLVFERAAESADGGDFKKIADLYDSSVSFKITKGSAQALAADMVKKEGLKGELFIPDANNFHNDRDINSAVLSDSKDGVLTPAVGSAKLKDQLSVPIENIITNFNPQTTQVKYTVEGGAEVKMDTVNIPPSEVTKQDLSAYNSAADKLTGGFAVESYGFHTGFIVKLPSGLFFAEMHWRTDPTDPNSMELTPLSSITNGNLLVVTNSLGNINPPEKVALNLPRKSLQ